MKHNQPEQIINETRTTPSLTQHNTAEHIPLAITIKPSHPTQFNRIQLFITLQTHDKTPINTAPSQNITYRCYHHHHHHYRNHNHNKPQYNLLIPYNQKQK
ncbi:hypothetical protein E2C01_013300 [Portunus trituberculatus]|uniref:Uncharacterized protein n=1 Tax=Portunus trituberculatus TaxID=210409 RepID=A0A5B7DG93_PORTR|nr:hypothetical protein [Portunus trituberculatus]